jgi:internalin A
MESSLTQITKYLLAQSWQIAILTIVIAFITILLKNKSAHIRYLLWMIVLAKCLIPPLYTISIAILPEKEETTYTPAPHVSEGTTYEYRVSDIAVNESPEPAPVHFETRALLAIGWIVGVAALSFYYLVNAIRTEMWLHKRRRELPREYKSNIEGFFKTYEVRRIPRIWQLDKINQPFVWGLVRGSIYLPSELINKNHTKFYTSLIGHELSHVIRFDALINSLQVIAQIIFWFHPFIWWTNRKIRTEREKCCDEMTIARQDTLPEEYSEAIVEILAAKYEQTRKVPSLAVAGKVKNIEERIKTMLRPGKKFYKRPSVIALIILLFVAFFTIPIGCSLTRQAKTEKAIELANKPAVAGETPAPPRYAARTFNSKVAFDVFVQKVWSSLTKERIGSTPSATPLQIPACWLWLVKPVVPVEDWDLLIREMSQNSVPALKLEWATDSDLSHLAAFTGLPFLDLNGAKITDAGLAHLEGLTGLSGLDLSATSITGPGLEHLKGMTKLQWLYLDDTSITDDGLQYLKELKGLRELNLDRTKITGAGLEHLKGMSGLQILHLTGTQLTDAGMEHLKNLTGLWGLALSATQITDAGVEHLRGLTGLNNLMLSCPKVTDAGVGCLKGMTGLQRLLLSGTQITDKSLENLGNLRELVWLHMSKTKITDAGLVHIKGLTKLTDLGLGSTQITDAGMANLKGLTGLKQLSLGSPQITDAGIANLKGLTGLEGLYFAKTQVTDAGLVHLKGLAGLKALDLSDQVTDAGLVHLKGLTGLEQLNLSNTKVTDAGLEHLKGLTALHLLNLSNTQVTDAGIQQLKQSLPNVTISK